MHQPALEDVLSCLNQAAARVDANLKVQWVEARFEEKTGLALQSGKSLRDILERSPARDELERAVQSGQRFTGRLISSTLQEIQVSCAPRSDGQDHESWVVVQPDVLDDELSFARAIQEIARAVGEILDRDAICAAAVMSMVRCAKVTRAEVYLLEGRSDFKRVAMSDVAGSASNGRERATWMEGTFKQALATGSPQIGISRGASTPSIFAVVPLMSQQRTLGLLLLHKEQGASFSARELDLWSAAGAHLAVALENARLLGEAQAALRIREEFMSIASHELKTPLTR